MSFSQSNMENHSPTVVVVGAGVAGLVAAKTLLEQARKDHATIQVRVVEAAPVVGGRVQTDEVFLEQDPDHENHREVLSDHVSTVIMNDDNRDNCMQNHKNDIRERSNTKPAAAPFLLDHGFQVLLTAYPEVRRQLDLKSLGVKGFGQGAVLASSSSSRSSLSTIANPLTYPRGFLGTARTILFRWGLWQTMTDVWKLSSRLICRFWLCASPYEADGMTIRGYTANNHGAEDTSIPTSSSKRSSSALLGRYSTSDFLSKKYLGLSTLFVQDFLRPFFEAIYVSPLEAQNAAIFSFVLRMLAFGSASLPQRGIRGVPEQLLQQITSSHDGCLDLQLNTRVRAMRHRSLLLSPGRWELDIETSNDLQNDYDGTSRGMINQTSGAGQQDKKTTIQCDMVILAVEWPVARSLLQDQEYHVVGDNDIEDGSKNLVLKDEPRFSTSCTYYFALPEEDLPVKEPLIVLHPYREEQGEQVEDIDKYKGDGRGGPLERPLLMASADHENSTPTAPPSSCWGHFCRIANIGFPSVVQRSYAPSGWHLCAVTVFRNNVDEYSRDKPAKTSVSEDSSWPSHESVLEQVGRMLYPADEGGKGETERIRADRWRFLRRYDIAFHQPAHGTTCNWLVEGADDNMVVLCGDYVSDPTLDGAMRSGRRAAAYAYKKLQEKTRH
ncbi:unnamed protein product [Amoebophrya sp. A25]|nr:unnamed protein product [Amoebophrya sp. A25]|eukprot:GSA25T00008967001.1